MVSTEGTRSGIKSPCLLTCSRKSKDYTRSEQKHSSTVRSFTQARGLAVNKLESPTLSKPSPACFPVAMVAKCLRNSSTSHQWEEAQVDSTSHQWVEAQVGSTSHLWAEAQVECRMQTTTKVSARPIKGISSKTMEVKITASGLPPPRPTRHTVKLITTCPQIWAVEASLSEVNSPWAAQTCRLAKPHISQRLLT